MGITDLIKPDAGIGFIVQVRFGAELVEFVGTYDLVIDKWHTLRIGL